MSTEARLWALGLRLAITAALLRLVEAVLDNDVRGIFTLGYRPQCLASRILAVPESLLTLASLAFLGALLFNRVLRYSRKP